MSDAPEGLPQGTPVLVLPILFEPINALGHTLTEIRIMRRPTALDVIEIQERPREAPLRTALAMVHRLSGVPTASLLALDAYDANALEDEMLAFLSRGPMTGAKGSGSLPGSLDSGA